MKSQKVAIVSDRGLSLIDIKDNTSQIYLKEDSSLYSSVFDKSGKYFCYCCNVGSYLINMENDSKVKLCSEDNFRKISFSPKGTYVSLLNPNNDKDAKENVSCFKTYDGSLVMSYKFDNTAYWAPQWSADEEICFRIFKSLVLFYSTEDISKHHLRMTSKGLMSASMCISNKKYLMGTYINEGQSTPNEANEIKKAFRMLNMDTVAKAHKSVPQMVRIYHYPNMTEVVNNQTFLHGRSVSFHWSPNGETLLFLVRMEERRIKFDGEHKLYFMNSKICGETGLIPLSNSQTKVHCLRWEPVIGEKFVVIHGSPVTNTVYNKKCQMLYNIDSPSRNICHFSNCGKSLALMSVANIKSPLQLWNFEANKMFGEFDIEDVNKMCWSGDDRYFVTATVSPSIKVNNGLIIWNVEGAVILNKVGCGEMIGNPKEVYDVLWQPTDFSPSTHCECNHEREFSVNSNFEKSIKMLKDSVKMSEVKLDQSKKKGAHDIQPFVIEASIGKFPGTQDNVKSKKKKQKSKKTTKNN